MEYVRVDEVLPKDLIQQIQKYVEGKYIYIPSRPEKRKKWGEKSKNQEYIKRRNVEILSKYKMGNTIANLAEEYYLSVSSIKKIVYKKKQ